MTPDIGDVRARFVAMLAVGDLVSPIEELRVATIEALEHIQAIDPTNEPASRVAEMRTKLEPYLARVVLLADHGGERGLEAVLAEVAMIATEEGELSDQPNADPLLTMALHGIVWTVAAHALTHDRTSIPARLGSVMIPSRYPGEAVGLFEAVALRHNQLFDRDAFRTFESLRDWLTSSQLREIVPRWQRETDLSVAIEEAELWAALRFAYSRQDPTWTPLVGADANASRRLRSRFTNPAVRSDLAELLGVSEDHAADALNASYARLAGANGRPFRDQLIPRESE